MSRLQKSGVLVTAALTLLGAVGAGVAWWTNLANTDRALEFWGPQAAVLIRDAPTVKAYRIAWTPTGGDPAAQSMPTMRPRFLPTEAQILHEQDISTARGLVHLRHALLDNRSFDWTPSHPEKIDFGYALTFAAEDSQLTVLISADCTRLATSRRSEDLASTAGASLRVSSQPIAAGLKKYLAEVLGE